ncbi:hypothetical protein GB937_004548 [Aspergillus fischeri]|nr:hypothetical protein GB937_004548 [Aspergillus fischeri]
MWEEVLQLLAPYLLRINLNSYRKTTAGHKCLTNIYGEDDKMYLLQDAIQIQECLFNMDVCIKIIKNGGHLLIHLR